MHLVLCQDDSGAILDRPDHAETVAKNDPKDTPALEGKQYLDYPE